MVGCSVCGSPEWIACQPGQAPYESDPKSKVTVLHPPEPVAAIYWCMAHWPVTAAPKQEAAHV